MTTDNEAVLIAAALTRIDVALATGSECCADIIFEGYDYGNEQVVIADGIEALATFHAYVDRVTARERRLRAFVERVADDQAYLDDMYRAVNTPIQERFAHAQASTRLSTRSREARELLAELDEK